MNMEKEPQLYGCFPNTMTPEAVDALEALAAPWDATEKPAICTWESYKPYLDERAEKMDRLRNSGKYLTWWKVCEKNGIDPEKLLIKSQGSIGSCAGVSYFDRCYLIALLKQIAAGSEQEVEPVNALATWLISKGWSRWGGQSIAAVVREGVSTGVFPSAMVGDYSTGWYDKDAAESHLPDAGKRQMGACFVPSNVSTPDAIELALRAGKAVEIGNGMAVASGTQKDENGVDVVRLSGSWSHATCFSELLTINGKKYYRWENSHGLIYDGTQYGPTFGGLMTRETLEVFCGSSFCDVAVVTYVESPYNMNIKPTLLPE